MLEKIEGRRRRGHQRMSWLDSIIDSMNMSLTKLQEMGGLARCCSWGCKESDTTGQLNTSNKVEAVTDCIFLGSRITADSDCSHEIQRCLLLGRKATTNLDCALKIRDITLLTKVHIVKAVVFPVVMYGCESWTIKKAECCRTDVFKLWY